MKLLNGAVGRSRKDLIGGLIDLLIHVEGNLRNSCFAFHSASGIPACSARVRCGKGRSLPVAFTKRSFPMNMQCMPDFPFRGGARSSRSAVAGDSTFPSPSLPAVGLIVGLRTHATTPAVVSHSWII